MILTGRIVSLQFVTPRLSTGRVRCTLGHNPLVLLLIDDECQLCQSHRHARPHPMLPTHHRTPTSCRCIRHFMDRVQHEIPNRLANRQREDQSDRIDRLSNLDESRGSRYSIHFRDPFRTGFLRIAEISQRAEDVPQRMVLKEGCLEPGQLRNARLQHWRHLRLDRFDHAPVSNQIQGYGPRLG